MKKIAIVVFSLLIIAYLISSSFSFYMISWGMHDPISNSSNVAILGYDPVAYFEQSEAEKGDENISYSLDGVTSWNFTSQENKSLFESNPEKYMPQFGGYCSWGVSRDFTIEPNYEVWHIENGKLYFYLADDPKAEWIADIPNGIIKNSEQNWNN